MTFVPSSASRRFGGRGFGGRGGGWRGGGGERSGGGWRGEGGAGGGWRNGGSSQRGRGGNARGFGQRHWDGGTISRRTVVGVHAWASLLFFSFFVFGTLVQHDHCVLATYLTIASFCCSQGSMTSVLFIVSTVTQLYCYLFLKLNVGGSTWVDSFLVF